MEPVSRPYIKIKDKFKPHFIRAVGGFRSPRFYPDVRLGELFEDVQLKSVYPDSITFVDLVPAGKLRRILKLYEHERNRPDFNLHDFVQTNFKQYLIEPSQYKAHSARTIEEHIEEMWEVLTRECYTNKGSLMVLPYPYIVPGGRYMCQFYWDSYFIILGMRSKKHAAMAEGMVKNLAFMIRRFGYIPSSNRTYYLGRSQPPFFSYMVDFLAEQKGKSVYVRYLPYLVAEYRFWMKGRHKANSAQPAYRRVIRMPDGSILNRYYDEKRTPRPEGYKEDVQTALEAEGREPSRVYLDIRAAAESGWDFSSRWLKDGRHMSTIRTTELVPIELNCLLAHLERTIARAYRHLKQAPLAALYERRMQRRVAAIHKYCWSAAQGYFMDYDFVTERQTDHMTLAGSYALFTQVATSAEAAAIAEALEKRFLRQGGLVTSLEETGQQWDAPNGWAALQWVAIKGLRLYGYYQLAEEIKRRWIEAMTTMYKAHGKLVEKYNVEQIGQPAGGGEYPLQDGFGMTNGVLMALLNEHGDKE